MDWEVALLTKQVREKLKTKRALVDDLMEHDWGKQLVKMSSSGSLQEICVKKVASWNRSQEKGHSLYSA
jgi:hypothetical protein